MIHGLTNSRSKLIKNAEKESLPYYIDNLEPEDKTLSAEDRQKYMAACRKAIYNSDNHHTYFLHGHKSGQLSMFSHPALQDVHLKQWYTDESSPLFDDTLRPILTTTTIPMLLMLAVGVRDLSYSYLHVLTVLHLFSGHGSHRSVCWRTPFQVWGRPTVYR